MVSRCRNVKTLRPEFSPHGHNFGLNLSLCHVTLDSASASTLLPQTRGQKNDLDLVLDRVKPLASVLASRPNFRHGRYHFGLKEKETGHTFRLVVKRRPMASRKVGLRPSWPTFWPKHNLRPKAWCRDWSRSETDAEASITKLKVRLKI